MPDGPTSLPVLRRARTVAARSWLSFQAGLSGLRPRDIGVLAGIRKSGNTYLRFLMANYVALVADANRKPLTYAEVTDLVGEALDVKQFYRGLQKKVDISALGVKRFFYTHHHYVPIYEHWRVVHLYRNPLDHIVSMYFYKYRFRPGQATRYSSPKEILFHLDEFFHDYKSFLGTPALRVAYEDLFERPKDQLKAALRFFGAPSPKEELLDLAVAHSSQDVIRAQESRDGPIHSPSGFEGRFVRDGSIGQFKTYFGPTEWKILEEVAVRYAVPLEHFRFEPAFAAMKSLSGRA